MRALDTNVLIRYLVQDDAAQGKKAAAYIENAEASGDQILIGDIVLCETAWVLDSAYGYSRIEIQSVLEKLLRSSVFWFENKDLVWAAAREYRETKADFADCLLGRVYQGLGSEPTVTFDIVTSKLLTFRLL